MTRPFRRPKPTRASMKSAAIMVVTGATPEAFARLTPEQLAHSYGIKIGEAVEMIERERGRRA